MTCPAADSLLSFVRGGSDGSANIETHLGECAVCRAAVIMLARSSLASPPRADDATLPDASRAPQLPIFPRGAPLGRYLILERIGQGGMGIVFSAYDPELDRRIALKLIRTDLRSAAGPAALKTRLLREAQAMARLAHPNVVPVYDVGVIDDQVFVAMEWVEGQTLSGWLRGEHPWREVLAMFVGAGRGLLAAHAAGLVHRDFKPDNVLVGKDGRPRVTDFGLARPAGISGSDEAPASPGSPLTRELTATGAVMGTPGYMAPEQMLGESTDSRADLFSFCVALYEALYAEKPFSGTSTDEKLASIREGRLAPPRAGSKVSREVQRALAAGLRADKEARTASMDLLLAQLTRASRPSRAWQWAALTLTAVALCVGGWRWTVHRNRMCKAAPSRMANVWDAPRKQQIHRAFAETRLPYAETVWQTVEQKLDEYTGQWVKMATEVCEATQLHNAQSDLLYERRQDCLESRLTELSTATTELSRADAEIVKGAASAADSLSAIDRCGNTQELLDAISPPKQADVEKIRQLDARQRRLKGLYDVGKMDELKVQANAIAAEARQLDYPAVEDEALYVQAYVSNIDGEYQEAQRLFEQAAASALRAHDEFTLAKAWTGVVEIAARLGRGEEGLRISSYLEAIARRQHCLAQALAGRAFLLAQMGRFEEAAKEARQALAVLGVDEDRSNLLTTRGNAANALMMAGRFDEGLPLCRRQVEDFTRTRGREHPDTLIALVNYGASLISARRPSEALPATEEAATLKLKAFPADSPQVLIAIINRGEAEEGADRLEAARDDLTHAIEIFDKHKAGGPDLVEALSHLGEVQRRLHDGRATVTLERALESGAKLPPFMTAPARFSLAQLLVGHDRARARTLAETARDAFATDKSSPFAQKDRDAVKAFLAAN